MYMQDNVAEQGVWKLRQRRKDSFPTSSLERERGGEEGEGEGAFIGDVEYR